MDLFANVGVHLDVRSSPLKASRAGAFTDNMKLPVHRWFRYSAGFSAEWVENVIGERSIDRKLDVLDPFCGSGTTLLAAASKGANATGFESHPFVYRIAKAKTQRDFQLEDYLDRARSVLSTARHATGLLPSSTSELLRRCYADDSLAQLEAIRGAYQYHRKGDQVDDLIWLTVTSILRECSGVGTAQWQYLLPNRTKSRVIDPFVAFERKYLNIASDLHGSWSPDCGEMTVVQTDARSPSLQGKFDMVVTSPPYPNNYDYADATRLEMSFWGEVSSWGDLHGAVRQYLVRACSQHSAADRLVLEDILDEPGVSPIRDELSVVCRELDAMRHLKAGKKTYHTMVAAYFADLARVWQSLRELVREGGEVAFVIGDSAPYGVHVPCDKWLAALAVSAGFHSPKFEKLRDRNTKWKNRKHRVPLQEGILWLKG